jgi:hypothetical protein
MALNAGLLDRSWPVASKTNLGNLQKYIYINKISSHKMQDKIVSLLKGLGPSFASVSTIETIRIATNKNAIIPAH